MNPYILSAAVRLTYNNRIVVLPLHRHCDFFDIAKQLQLQYDKNVVEQGFIAYDQEKEYFVNRAAAYKIAKAANQITNSTTKEILYSEDLY